LQYRAALLACLGAAMASDPALAATRCDPAAAAAAATPGGPTAFARLYAAWRRESERIAFSSNTRDYAALPSFRRIVALGPPAVPLLTQKLTQDRGIDFMLAEAVVQICGWDRSELAGASEQALRDNVLKRLEPDGFRLNQPEP